MTTEYRPNIPSHAHIEAATRLGLGWANTEDYIGQSCFRPIRPDGTPVDWETLDAEVARVAGAAQPQGFRADLWRRISRHFTLERVSVLSEIQGMDSVCIRTRTWQWGWGTADREAPTQQQRADILNRWIVYRELKPLYDLVDGATGEAAMPRDVAEALQATYFRDASFVVNGRDNNGRVCLHIRDENNHTYSPSMLCFSGTTLNDRLANFAAVLDAIAEARVRARQGQTERETRTVTVAQGTQPVPVGTLMMQNPDGTVSPARAGQQPIGRLIEPTGDGFVVHSQLLDRTTRQITQTVIAPLTLPEPRRFADVRPDRHGWRWWRVWGRGCHNDGSLIIISDDGSQWDTAEGPRMWQRWSPNLSEWFDRTVIPTDEQGNPVSWDSIGPTDPTEMRYRQAFAARVPAGAVQAVTVQASPGRVYDVEWAQTNATTGTLRDVHTARIRQLDRFVADAIQAGNTGGFSVESRTPPRPSQFSNNPTTPPLTPEGLLASMQNYAVPGVHITVGTGAKSVQTEAFTTLPPPLPRFTTDELDDVDHSKTTKLDEVTLRRGKLPTVEQIAKYREIRAKRTGGTVADALKKSRIDCEVAQYVLERWAGGLGDELALWLLRAVGKYSRSELRFTQRSVDELAQRELTHEAGAIETAESSPTMQRERQEAEERRQRLAELRRRLAAERAMQPAEEAPTAPSRFDLIEPDPQADPAASIRAWEARQAAAKVRPVAAHPRIAKPAAALRRPAIEVVDAEADGLSRVEVVTALFGRALNGGC